MCTQGAVPPWWCAAVAMGAGIVTVFGSSVLQSSSLFGMLLPVMGVMPGPCKPASETAPGAVCQPAVSWVGCGLGTMGILWLVWGAVFMSAFACGGRSRGGFVSSDLSFHPRSTL